MKAHVIRMNDGVMGVVIGTPAEACTQKERLAKEYFDRMQLKFQYDDKSIFRHTGDNPYDRYRRHVYWHIDEVSVLDSRFTEQLNRLSAAISCSAEPDMMIEIAADRLEGECR